MNTGPARGMRDFLPEDVRRRQYVIGVIADVYQRYGFEPLETPAVENIETLMGKYGEEGDRLIFKILKRGEGAETGQADLALRYDLTVPLARVIAEHGAKLPKFFKRYQIQPVWRADRPQKGRFREFYQCDVDAIGSSSMLVEAELLAAAAEVFKELGFKDFVIRLNHRKLLEALLGVRQVSKSAWSDFLTAADDLDKISLSDAVARLAEKGHQIDDAASFLNWLHQFKWRRDEGRELSEINRGLEQFATLFNIRENDPEQDVRQSAQDAVRQLMEILRLSEGTAAANHVVFDFSLARGLSYYTGSIFEIVVPDLAGSLGGGGRYDNLVGMFGRRAVPACGVSLGLERILVVMSERDMFRNLVGSVPAELMVTVKDADSAAASIRVAAMVRAQGLRTELYPAPDKLGKQLQYASQRGIRYAVILSENSDAVQVRNVVGGTQESVSVGGLADYIKRRVLKASSDEAWRMTASRESVVANLDEATLCVQLGMAANAIGAAQRAYLHVSDERGPSGEFDRLWAFLLGVGFLYESLRLVAGNVQQVEALAERGGAPAELRSQLHVIVGPGSRLLELSQRIRNKLIFEWDGDLIRSYIQGLGDSRVSWAESVGEKRREAIFAIAANAVTNSMLPDDEPSADSARNLERLRELLAAVSPAMHSIVLLCNYAVMGYLQQYDATIDPE